MIEKNRVSGNGTSDVVVVERGARELRVDEGVVVGRHATRRGGHHDRPYGEIRARRTTCAQARKEKN